MADNSTVESEITDKWGRLYRTVCNKLVELFY